MRPSLLDGKVFSISPHRSTQLKLLNPTKYTPQSQSDKCSLGGVFSFLFSFEHCVKQLDHSYLFYLYCIARSYACVQMQNAEFDKKRLFDLLWLHFQCISIEFVMCEESRSNASFKLSSMESIEVNRNLMTFVWGVLQTHIKCRKTTSTYLSPKGQIHQADTPP